MTNQNSATFSYDYAVHSDFLIHWTGKDIDENHQSKWYESDKSLTNFESESAYRKRFLDILRYGLWMTCEPGFEIEGGTTPETPKCCLTELKLSESRRHARLYGRLGIGVKRPFVFDLLGRPLVYFGFGPNNRDSFLGACAKDLRNRDLLNFFKPMNSGRPLNYDLYSESEWRIIFFDELLAQKKIMDPRDNRNSETHEYFKSLPVAAQSKLKYLVPLDGWFATIIYPSLNLKIWAQQSGSPARDEIQRIKSLPDHGNRVEGGNWPIEVHLDSCRHF